MRLAWLLLTVWTGGAQGAGIVEFCGKQWPATTEKLSCGTLEWEQQGPWDGELVPFNEGVEDLRPLE